MTAVIEFFVAACIVIGAVFLFVGSLGLATLPDTMRRLHAPTKATTLGIGALLIASMLYFVLLNGSLGVHEILITLFLFLTAPATAIMIAKAYIFRHRGTQEKLPPSANKAGWATLNKAR
ncbi:MAG: Na+/H+ antiporter subunit G [Pseudolabrys sp.]|nr:Na+/H+ antiporter subunit G [Pseudolabrys sp.]MDP2297975.1 Na+/H+ antiporter subunit G [Pseudolabrys sp.]